MALRIQTKAEQAAAQIIRLTSRIPRRLASYADQAIRASGSAALNLAEGYGRHGKSKLYHYSVAYGSAREASSALRILLAAQAVDHNNVQQALGLLDEVAAAAYRLTTRS